MRKSLRKQSAESMAFATEKSSTITAGAVRYLSTFERKHGPDRIERNHETEKTRQVTPRDVAGGRHGALRGRRRTGANTRQLDAQKTIRRRTDSFGPPSVSRRNRRM